MKSVVDHIIIAVADLEQATQDYAAMLGRKPSWQGSHPDYGTANSLFRLDNSYLELLAATGAGWAADAVNGHIAAKGQGLMGLVFGTDDAEAFVAHANANGLEASAPIAGHGLDANSGARRDWRNMVWDTKAARGIFSFAIQHDDPEALPMAEPMGDGAVTAIDHVVVQTSDTQAAKDFYGKQLGVRLALEQSRPEWGGDMLFFRCNSMSIEVIGSDKYDAEQDALWGLALKTGDIDATHKRLTGAGIDVSEIRDGRKPGTRVCTVKSHCLDVPTLIVGLVD
ncbi:MAG: VOC family protein [Rhodobiaceae bacterium]|jgi:catechol 2,3-dioxygenase-like lactoylglutathione lyase family enzyme